MTPVYRHFASPASPSNLVPAVDMYTLSARWQCLRFIRTDWTVRHFVSPTTSTFTNCHSGDQIKRIRLVGHVARRGDRRVA